MVDMIRKVKNIDEMELIAAVDDAEDFGKYFPGTKTEVMEVFTGMIDADNFGVWYDPGQDGKIDFYIIAFDGAQYPVAEGVCILYTYSRDSIFNHREAMVCLNAWAKQRGSGNIRLNCDPGAHERVYGNFGFIRSKIVMELHV
jgi:hypothetical protein